MSKTTWSKKRLILGIVILAIIGTIWYTGLHKNLSFEQVQCNAVWLREQVDQHYWWSVMIYLGIFITIILCGLPVAALMNIIGGFLFGMVQGVFFIILAALIGGTIFFFIVRYVIGSYLQSRFTTQLHAFNRMCNKRGWLFLLMLRCIPVIPFFMVNLLAGLTNIRPFTFIWTTAIGVIPTAVIFTYAGRQLGTIDQVRDIFTIPILGALVIVLVLAFLPILVGRYRKIF